MKNDRIWFCDELRGFSAFIVMFSHFTIGFNSLHGYLFNPNDSIDIFPEWFLKYLFVDGALGVAIFFLISGFIIPFSLQKKSSLTFLIARAIRIYPVYIVSAFLTMLLGFIFYNWDYRSILLFLKSITLFRDWIGGPAIDGVLWTLEIEVKFYLYMAVMLPVFRKKPEIVLLVPIFFISILIVVLNFTPVYPMAYVFLNYHSH